MLRIYNSLSRQKQTFTPIEANKVGMYVCGITVYDYCHLGHARMFVVFDMVARYLRWSGYELNYVRNITDIDDKIIRRAEENQEDFSAVTARFIDEMNHDSDLLNVQKPDQEPRATAHIAEIIDIISNLQAKDFAYQGSNGDVYFRVRRFSDYGKLSGESVDDLRSGARIASDESKDDPLDFVLWKKAKPGEPAWSSPWGDGRPGWHIECSAMSASCLGKSFDIHAGGMDLRFPHHENEIAQSEAANECTFANVWMHNGFVNIDDEKMSKSLGNFRTIRSLLETDSNPRRMGEVIRFMMLMSHYRSPLSFSDVAIDNAKSGLTRIYLALSQVAEQGGWQDVAADQDVVNSFRAVMDDDFNSSEAMAVIFDEVRRANRAVSEQDKVTAASAAATIDTLLKIFGLGEVGHADFLRVDNDSDDEISRWVEQRDEARAAKDWALADELRDRIQAKGVILEDKDGKTTWRKG